MRESEKSLEFDHWQIIDANHIVLESPMFVMGAGHLDVYLEDPQNAFEGFGIAVKNTLPDAIKQVFNECETRGDKLHVDMVIQGLRHSFILTHRPDAGRYPWRLVKE
jgi:hypothetical protein